MKFAGLSAAIILTFASYSVYAAESHMAQTLEHAEAAVEATDGKVIAEHAEVAKTHAVTADEHLDAGIKSLDEAIKHGKLGHRLSEESRRRSRNSPESRTINNRQVPYVQITI